MIRNLIIILLSILVFSCKSTIYDKYEPEFNRENQNLSVVVRAFDSELDMRMSLEGIRQEGSKKIHKGLAVYYLNSNECTIYIVKPSKFNGRGDYAKTLGHELMHCLYGDYH